MASSSDKSADFASWNLCDKAMSAGIEIKVEDFCSELVRGCSRGADRARGAGGRGARDRRRRSRGRCGGAGNTWGASRCRHWSLHGQRPVQRLGETVRRRARGLMLLAAAAGQQRRREASTRGQVCAVGRASASTIGEGARARRAEQTKTSPCRRISRSFRFYSHSLLHVLMYRGISACGASDCFSEVNTPP